MKKIISMSLSVALALSMCGCGEKDKKDNKKNSQSSSEINVIQPDVTPQFMDSQLTENTFSFLGEVKVNCNCSNVFYANLFCTAPEGIADGVYSSPDVTATVDGNTFDIENLAYININNGKATVSVSAFVGFVKKDSVITVTVKNFNELNPPEEEGMSVAFDDISDKTVIEGSFTLKSTADEDFGYLRYELLNDDFSYIALNNNTATIHHAQGLLDKNADADCLTVVMSDNSKINFDICVPYIDGDNNDEDNEIYNFVLTFEDKDKTINLGEVKDIMLNGESVIK